jgi:hypothetical protein
MASVLTIGGSTVDRSATRTKLDRLHVSYEGYDTLEFHQLAATLPASWHAPQAVTLTVGGTLRFTGQITSIHYGFQGDLGWSFVYRAQDLRYVADQIPITNANDQTGTISYNLPADDPDYVAANSGLSVGAIVKALIDAHQTALTAAGIGTYTLGDLTAMAVVPPEVVTFAGERFWQPLIQFVHRWAPNHVGRIEPDGSIRFRDSTTMSATTFTLGTDPLEPPSVSRDLSECATRVVIRGAAKIEAAQVSLERGTLTKGFTSTDETNWSLYDFTEPRGGFDDGDVSSLTSTGCSVTSADATKTWSTGYWSGLNAWVCLINPTASGITQCEFRRITSSAAHTAASTTAITWDSSQPLDNSGYTKYHIVGSPGGLSDTHRLYNITYSGSTQIGTPNTHPSYVAQHLVKKAPFPLPWRPNDQITVQTNYPAAVVCWSPTGSKPYIEMPATFELLPNAYQIRFAEPVTRIFGTLSNLQTGGASTDGVPTDIKVLLFYSRGTLTATKPASSYEGTAFTVDGLQRTLTIDCPQWLFAGDQARMDALCQQHLDSVKDAVVEGQLVYHGLYAAGLGLNMSVNIAANYGSAVTTGWEAIAACLRSFELTWPESGADQYRSVFQFSTKRRPFSGDKLYMPVAFKGHGFDQLNEGFGAEMMGMGAHAAPGVTMGQGMVGMGGLADMGGMAPTGGLAPTGGFADMGGMMDMGQGQGTGGGMAGMGAGPMGPADRAAANASVKADRDAGNAAWQAAPGQEQAQHQAEVAGERQQHDQAVRSERDERHQFNKDMAGGPEGGSDG